MERSGDREAQSEPEVCLISRSPTFIAPTGRAPPSTSPTTSRPCRPSGNSSIGKATTVEWPSGIGAKGNDGVANNVATTPGAIGYVEFAYAKQNKLTFASMINKAGKTVAPTMDAFQAAAANADWSVPGFYQILANQPGDKSWPMTAATFILMYKKPADVAASDDALQFFKWAYEKGDKMAQDLDYIPMPDNVTKLVEAMWAKDIQQK